MLNIKVVGRGCANCERLVQLCREVIEETQLAAEIEKITDINRFADFGILITPGLLINNKVYSSGRIPDKATLMLWLHEASSK
jgi:small redox-active disulfide protein 2